MLERTLPLKSVIFLILYGCSETSETKQTLDTDENQETIEIIRFRPGERCKANPNCESLLCKDGFCAEPSCKDATLNGLETDIDCGGSVCPRCPASSPCLTDDDCLSLRCYNQTCSDAACQNGAQDGLESDIDCGGSCNPCSQGQRCRWDSDCNQTLCQNQTCAPPSCQDRLHNGDERDTDCGPTCGPCRSGQTCTSGTDCIQGSACIDRICVLPETCSQLYEQGQRQSGLYWIDPNGPLDESPEISVYCDMQTLGGGWMLVGRSRPGGHTPSCLHDVLTQPFGWFAQSGDLSDDSRPYSLGVGNINLPFNEVIWGDYSDGKAWGEQIYHHNLPPNFVDRYRGQPVLVGDPTTVQGACTPTRSMFIWMGFTLNVESFYFRDLADNGWGLYADGFHTCYSDCDQGGLLNGKPGMIMVK